MPEETKSVEEVVPTKPAETVQEKVEELAEGVEKTVDKRAERDELSELIARNKIMAEQLDLEKELRAKLLIGGKTDAGREEKTPEDVAKEKAAEALKPFGF